MLVVTLQMWFPPRSRAEGWPVGVGTAASREPATASSGGTSEVLFLAGSPGCRMAYTQSNKWVAAPLERIISGGTYKVLFVF